MKLRIAVSIDEKGNWQAMGGNKLEEDYGVSAEDFAQELVNGVLHWVEADVPIPEKPETQTIKGEVVCEHL